MTKKDIVKTISEKINMTQLTTKGIVQETFDTIVETLVREGRIELRNFGVFEAKERAARKARNPRTEEPVDVPSKIVVTFKPGKRMAERVKNMDPEILDSSEFEEGETEDSDATAADSSPSDFTAPAADGASSMEADPTDSRGDADSPEGESDNSTGSFQY